MTELNITDEQKDAIDSQIRKRVSSECIDKLSKRQKSGFMPLHAIIYERQILDLSIDLEITCPYMRKCENKSPALCIENPYRKCSHYATYLRNDIFDNKIDLKDVGLRALVG